MFDAFPIHTFAFKNGGWREKLVTTSDYQNHKETRHNKEDIQNKEDMEKEQKPILLLSNENLSSPVNKYNIIDNRTDRDTDRDGANEIIKEKEENITYFPSKSKSQNNKSKQQNTKLDAIINNFNNSKLNKLGRFDKNIIKTEDESNTHNNHNIILKKESDKIKLEYTYSDINSNNVIKILKPETFNDIDLQEGDSYEKSPQCNLYNIISLLFFTTKY